MVDRLYFVDAMGNNVLFYAKRQGSVVVVMSECDSVGKSVSTMVNEVADSVVKSYNLDPKDLMLYNLILTGRDKCLFPVEFLDTSDVSKSNICWGEPIELSTLNDPNFPLGEFGKLPTNGISYPKIIDFGEEKVYDDEV